MELIHGTDIIFLYKCLGDIQETENFMKNKNFQHVSHFKMRICTSVVNDIFCEHIKYVLEIIKEINEVSFMCDSNCDQICYNTLDILLIFSGVENIKMSLSTHDNVVISPTIKMFLQCVSTKKLYLDEMFITDKTIIKIVTENVNIKHINTKVYSHQLLNLNYVIPKINKLKIYEPKLDVNMIKNLFLTIPDLTSLTINTKTYCETEINKIQYDVVKELVTHVKSNSQFSELKFCYCGLNDDTIEYICDNLIDHNIHTITFKDNYRYKNKSVNSIIKFIKNNSNVRVINIYVLNDIDTLINILNVLNDSKIVKFATAFKHSDYVIVDKIRNEIVSIISKNYLLTDISITVFSTHFTGKINTSSITNRNIELYNQKRFKTTKRAV